MPRRAFTLFELVVVIILIAVAAGIAFPVIDSMMHPNQVSAATDTVRSHLEKARSRALEEGRSYRFSIVENGAKFRIEPDDGDVNSDAGYVMEGELPETCLFVTGGAGIVDANARPTDGPWKSVAVFLPDGTAREDVELSFGRPKLLRVTLKLRALTGSIGKAETPK